MRDWFAEAIAVGIERGELDASGADPERIADRVLALADGYGVRVLIGDLAGRARAPRDLGCAGARPGPSRHSASTP